MKRFFIIISLLITCSFFYLYKAKAQTCKDICHIYAYYVIHTPGIIAADKNGKPLNSYVDTVNFIYVETPSNVTIEWKNAWKNGTPYFLDTKEVTSPVKVSEKYYQYQPIIIIANTKNRIWLLTFSRIPDGDNNVSLPPGKVLRQGQILLVGKKGKKTIYRVIENQTILHGPDAS